ncbi:MAG: hypothetical protein ABJ263_09050 [Tateyamaria sp.]|uniref:hypothetical protein n=1 Tax=Tateyamaria sp. TaxID=1929288 RepID=UPI0032949173
MDSIGIVLVQDFDQQKIEAYIWYRKYSYVDDTVATFQDASSYIIGMRWRF